MLTLINAYRADRETNLCIVTADNAVPDAIEEKTKKRRTLKNSVFEVIFHDSKKEKKKRKRVVPNSLQMIANLRLSHLPPCIGRRFFEVS